jgi:hypothetical protein
MSPEWREESATRHNIALKTVFFESFQVIIQDGL